MRTKLLVVFLLFNAFLAALIIRGFFTDKEVVSSAPVIKKSELTVEAVPPVQIKKDEVVVEKETKKPIEPLAEVVNKENNCVSFGPLLEDEKNMMGLILSKVKNKDKVTISLINEGFHEIYWDLGKNRVEAEKIFQKQKESGGAMADEKYVLKEDGKNWIVKVARIKGTTEKADGLTKGLAEKAKKAGAGGVWKFRETNEWFYEIKNYNELEENVTGSIDLLVSSKRVSCLKN